ncbi:zinc ribbon domain-containing protein [Urbifossiella limnaea]|uniref:Uncharacterized protein n=1 Tax=Urbifossiella limnaea TaxID=2528023 RepID=A0A517XLK8_9BACT|nr:hypothetical protein [Urbifossiella limnaea]QDU18393.1 hypothetical protein ETAA1_02790 [Urbifossiella limnaea]
MPLLEVACPGCQAVLKTPHTAAGKKARCKRCNTSFRIPGAPAVDSVGDSQQLSAVAPAPALKPPPPPEEDIPSATAVDDDEPLPASVADDEPLPAAVADDPPADPFAFSAAPAKAADAGDPFSFTPAAAPKAARKPRDADDEDAAPAPRKKPKASGGSGLIKIAVAAAVFALVAGGVVAGVLVYLANTKPGEVAKGDGKNEKKLDPPPNEPTPPPPEKEEPPAKGKETKGSKGTTPPGVGKGTKGSKGGSGAMLALPAGKPLTFPPRPAAPKDPAAPASNPVPLAVPFAEVRRFFPPGVRDAEIGVAWRSAAGFQGAGEKITLTLFSADSGRETAKVEADGDGAADPACDLSADAGTFAIGNRTTGRVTVWDVKKKAKKLDAFDPFAAKPEHKAAKLAAVYLTQPPDKVVTVTTAGVVNVWDVATKAEVGEFVPPRAAPGKVVAGRGTAVTTNRQGVVVAVGGAVYAVSAVGAVGGSAVAELGGDVGRSLALSVSPAGRVVYAFETDADGKKERAVAHMSEGKTGPILRWPSDAPEPTAAWWAGDRVAAVSAGPGTAVVIDADEGFRVQGVVRAAEDKMASALTESLWGLIPAAGDAKRCVAVEMGLPLPGGGDLIGPASARPIGSLVLDLRGLSQ